MKKFFISFLLCFGYMTLVAGGDSLAISQAVDNNLITAAQTGDLETLKKILSNENPSLGTIVDRAFLEAFDKKQSKDVQLFLLSKSTTKGSLLSRACTHGPQELVNILLEDDAQTDVRNTIPNHCHIHKAKDAGQIAIAHIIKNYLVNKGYDYAGTIDLEK